MTFSILGVTASREMSPPAIYGRDVYYNGIYLGFISIGKETREKRRKQNRAMHKRGRGARMGAQTRAQASPAPSRSPATS
jgi:hypothetical protein